MGRRAKGSGPLEVAVRAVREAGRILTSRMGKLQKSQMWLKGESDWVTEVDQLSEKAIIRLIQSAFPEHTVKAEETAPASGPSRHQWLIDPLDGTVNYMHRFPMFGISVALMEAGVLEVGVIYDPLREELFTARRGQGAWLNGRPIRVSSQPTLENSMLATGFPFRAKRYLDIYLESFRQMLLKTGSIRRAGSAALDLAYTACGRVDGFWEMALASWDVAAGALLIREAGGKVSDFFDGDSFLQSGHITAANPTLHAEMVRILAPIFQGKLSV